MNFHGKLRAPSFPLLGKELLETANRRATYIFRFLIIAITGLLIVFFAIDNSNSPSPIGDDIFIIVVVCQFVAALIILPGIMGATITQEKERNSLEILLLTRMSPWEIVMQKYLSRIIPILMFFFLGLPFLSMAYSFGGLDDDILIEMPIFLISIIIQIGAISIMFSAYCRTTAGAVIASYIAVVIDGTLITGMMNRLSDIKSFYQISDRTAIMLISAAIAASAPVCLALAIYFLRKRPHSSQGESGYVLFLHRLDKFWKATNKLCGSVELASQGREPGPLENPIEWYEKTRGFAGPLNYRIRLAIIVVIPAVALTFSTALLGFSDTQFMPLLLLICYLVLAGFVVSIMGSSVVASERYGQRLDVLLTTNVLASDIVRNKMRKSKTLIAIFGVPIAILSSLLMTDPYYDHYRRPSLFNLIVLTALILLVYMPLISWFSCWIGLLVKSHGKAIIVSVVSIFLWVIIPPLLFELIQETFHNLDEHDFLGQLFLFSSPLYPVLIAINRYVDKNFNIVPILIATSLQVLLYFLFKFLCLRNAEKYLRGHRE